MKSNTGVVSLVLVLMAASSLVSMFSVLRIDSIVHGDLYRFGLQFSYQWALPYWTMTTIVFAVGWFNIIVSIAFQFYVLLYSRKEAPAQETPSQLEQTPTKEVMEATQKPDEQTPEKLEPPVEEPKEPLPSQETAQPVENVETAQTEEAQTQVEVPAETTDNVAETYPQEQPAETESEHAVEEQQQPQESPPEEQQPVAESQEPQSSTNEAEQPATAKETEETQPIIEVPIAPEEQQPAQTTTSEGTSSQQPVEPSQT